MHIKFDNGQDDSILMMFWILGRFAEVQDCDPVQKSKVILWQTSFIVTLHHKAEAYIITVSLQRPGVIQYFNLCLLLKYCL